MKDSMGLSLKSEINLKFGKKSGIIIKNNSNIKHNLESCIWIIIITIGNII